MFKRDDPMSRAIDALCDQVENGHLIAVSGDGSELLLAAAEKIKNLEAVQANLVARILQQENQLYEGFKTSTSEEIIAQARRECGLGTEASNA